MTYKNWIRALEMSILIVKFSNDVIFPVIKYKHKISLRPEVIRLCSVPTLFTIGLKKHGVKLGTRPYDPFKVWQWKEKDGITFLKVESQSSVLKYDLGSKTSGNGFGTFEKFHDFLSSFFDFT